MSRFKYTKAFCVHIEGQGINDGIDICRYFTNEKPAKEFAKRLLADYNEHPSKVTIDYGMANVSDFDKNDGDFREIHWDYNIKTIYCETTSSYDDDLD